MTLFKKQVLGWVSTIFLLSAPAMAQTMEKNTERHMDVAPSISPSVSYDSKLIARPASTTEQIGMAFLKLSGTYPDFRKVIESSKVYQSLDPLAQADYLAKTESKYHADYLGFSPDKSDLIVRVKISTLFKRTKDRGAVLTLRTLQKTPVYFPFVFGPYPIAVLVKNIEFFQTINLTRPEADIVYSRLALNGDATLLLQLRPITANDKTPIVLDNTPQYPLLSEIAYIGLLNNKAEQIWAWKNTKSDLEHSRGQSSLIDLVPKTSP